MRCYNLKVVLQSVKDGPSFSISSPGILKITNMCVRIQSWELEIGVYWRDWRALCGVKFLRLEDFLDNQRHGMCLYLEPQGMLFAEVTSTLISQSQ